MIRTSLTPVLRLLLGLGALVAVLASSLGITAVTAPSASAASVTCTVTAGEPVVVVENGVRYLQSYSTVRCSGTAARIELVGWMKNGSGYVMRTGSTEVRGSTAANIRMRAVCSNVRTNSYQTTMFGNIYFSNGAELHLRDVSPMLARSCG